MVTITTTAKAVRTEPAVPTAKAVRTEPAVPTAKAVRTRAAIIDAALTLFRERGYDETTMRAIAATAGVSAGNAYYYFASKESLILGFYDRAGAEHRATALPALEGVGDLAERITIAVDSWITVMTPYRAFAGKFFRNAAEPTSPLSPFSPESATTRQQSIDLWNHVVEGATSPVPAVVAGELPGLLWLYSMGIVLFWVHDQSDDAGRSRLLVRRTAPLLARAVELSGMALLQTAIQDTLHLIAELRSF